MLYRMRDALDIQPRVIYDIGACVLDWTAQASHVWPHAEIVVFDALEEVRHMYQGHQHHIGVLGHADNTPVKYYQNLQFPTGSSYYMEIGGPRGLYHEDVFVPKTMQTLDTVVAEKAFPRPDLVKIDVQGAEMDVLKGALDTLKHATALVVEMQHVPYNRGAPLVTETLPFIESLGWECVAPRFCNNGPDADYLFVKTKASQVC